MFGLFTRVIGLNKPPPHPKELAYPWVTKLFSEVSHDRERERYKSCME